MSIRRAIRLLLILSPTFALLGVGTWYAATHATPPPPAPARGKLVVLLVFDQMRGDYLDRWQPLFGTDGFRKLEADGVRFSDAHLPYAAASTAPGHASIATGAPPAVHGIVENDWYDRKQGRKVYCAYGDRPYERVPRNPDAGSRTTEIIGMAPDRLLAPTVADALRAATGGKGRAVSLALKDRAAVLMGGKEPAACYCFDTDTGQFHTSAYYRERPHSWVERFNRTNAADRWFGQAWTRFGDAATYDRLAGPDDAPGEYAGSRGAAFPHPLSLNQREPNGRYYGALESSPFANELLWELAKVAIEEEHLGRGDAPDLLMLGFSANDVIGHAWGPDSHEVLDVTVRSDRLVAAVLAHLTATLGPDHFAVIVTADHGVCPLPEHAVKEHPAAERFEFGSEYGALGAALDAAFGRHEGGPGKWVERVDPPWIYLDRKAAVGRDLPAEELERYAARWVGNRPRSVAAFARHQIAGPPLADPLGRMVQLSFHPDRCGDVCVVTKPYTLWTGKTLTGTNHGTPHAYDTHVPILALGAGVPKLGRRTGRVSSLLVAPIVCRALGIDPPVGAAEPLPEGFEVQKR